MLDDRHDDRQVFETAPIALAVLALDGRVIDANPAFCDLFGLTDASLRSLDASAITHPDDRDRTSDRLSRLASGEIDEY